MSKVHKRRTVGSISVLAGLLLAALGSVPASASADSPCDGVDLGVTNRVVSDGGWVGVHGTACTLAGDSGQVRIKLQSGAGARTVGVSSLSEDGRFSTRVRVRAGRGRIATLRAAAFGQVSRPIKVRVLSADQASADGGSGDSDQSRSAPASSRHEDASPQPSQPQPAPAEVAPGQPAGSEDQAVEGDISPSPMPSRLVNPDPGSDCPLNDPEAVVEATVSDCRVVGSDTAADADPLKFWGTADCGTWPDKLEPGRPTHPTSGGDTHPTATGAPQGNEANRVLTTFDGDDIAGERCELGRNDMDTGPTTYFYEGMRRATFFSMRLPQNFQLDTPDWQTVFQMKQDQPSQDDGGGPMIEMQATRGQWVIANDWNIVWSFPARKEVWTRFAFDVVYSQDPDKGSIQVNVDLNDDGDFSDPDERSPKISGATLSTQTTPGYEIAPGDPIPSHLRAGIYHNTKFSCPRPVGCSTELDNLQVVAP